MVLVLCWLGSQGCRGARMEQSEAVFEWVLESTDSAATLRVRSGAVREQRALRAVERLRVWLREPGGELVEEGAIVPSVSGMAMGTGEAASLLLQGELRLRSAPAALPERVLLEYAVESKEGVVRGSQWVQRMHRHGALVLVPEVEERGDTVLFRLRVRRLQLVAGEYFPTSERLRVEIFHGVKKLWSSADGVAFLQVLGEVEPRLPGEEAVYEYRWNGRLASGERLPEGRYSVRLTLPVRPEGYGVTFLWRRRA